MHSFWEVQQAHAPHTPLPPSTALSLLTVKYTLRGRQRLKKFNIKPAKLTAGMRAQTNRVARWISGLSSGYQMFWTMPETPSHFCMDVKDCLYFSFNIRTSYSRYRSGNPDYVGTTQLRRYSSSSSSISDGRKIIRELDFLPEATVHQVSRSFAMQSDLLVSHF
jgi:hypothetical protein